MKKKKIKSRGIILNILKSLVVICVLYNVCYFINTVITKKEYFNILEISFFCVNTSNMEPNLNKNDFIITKENRNDNYEENDIVEYVASDQIKIGQIVEKKSENDKISYNVKINNTYYPENIRQAQIIGRVLINIPVLGFLVKILQTKVVTILVSISLIFFFIYNRYKYLKGLERRRKKKRKNDNYWNE